MWLIYMVKYLKIKGNETIWSLKDVRQNSLGLAVRELLNVSPLLRDHLSMAEGVVSDDRFYSRLICTRNTKKLFCELSEPIFT